MDINPLLQSLLEMGFPKNKAEKALQATDYAGISQAMDWLISHDGDADDANDSPVEIIHEKLNDTSKAPDPASNEAAANIAAANSYKCDDCGRLLKNEQEVEFHAGKTSHANFSESTEVVKGLTDEERKERMAKLQETLKLKRQQKEENERKSAIEAEKNRRRSGQEMQATRERIQEQEMKKILEDRKRQKKEDAVTKQRILEQIKHDKEARKMDNKGTPEPVRSINVVDTDKAQPSIPNATYDTCRIQIRQPNGQALSHTFKSKEQLSAVRLFLQLNRTDGSTEPFTLTTTFPKRVFSEEHMDATLECLGLVPSAVLMMVRSNIV